MELKFRVFGRVAKPVAEVFEAVVDPASLSAFFTTGGAVGRLEKGATVTWDFADFPGAFPVQVVEVVTPEKIVLRWPSNEAGASGQETEVTMVFSDTGDGRTLVEISESGWGNNQSGLKASYGSCMGWAQMVCALKLWVERKINLREGMYV